MDSFKQQCRNILGLQDQNAALNLQEESVSQPIGYGSEVLDIVTAYKSLKLAMNKNLKGLEQGREHCQGKGYLKPTINSRQVQRINLGLPPLGEST